MSQLREVLRAARLVVVGMGILVLYLVLLLWEGVRTRIHTLRKRTKHDRASEARSHSDRRDQ